MKRPYEITVVFRILTPEEEMQQAVDQVIAWIENSNEIENPGKVTRIDRNLFGRRRLAYEIDGQREGQYIIFYADIDAEHLTEMELNFKLYTPILRYLIVRDETPAAEDNKANDSKKGSQEVPVDAEEALDAEEVEEETEEETEVSE